MFIKTISESKYSTYKQCQLKYKYQYIDKYEIEDATIDHFQFGSYIHQVFEEGVNLSSVEELTKLSEEIKTRYTISEAYTGKDLICFRNFIPFNKNLGETVSTELKFEVPLKDDITLNGIIDRVIKGKNGGYLIIDYKTSKREKTKFELYKDSQLKGYSYAASKLFNVPLDKIHVAHFYPLTGNLVTVQFNTPQVFEYVKTVVDTVWVIRKKKTTDFKPCRNEFCNWCVFKGICSEFNSTEAVQHKIKLLEEAKALKKDSHK